MAIIQANGEFQFKMVFSHDMTRFSLTLKRNSVALVAKI